MISSPARSLLTDLYQLTMAQGYFLAGRERDEAVFNLSFRTAPFEGSYAVACGQADIPALVESWAVGGEAMKYLAGLRGTSGRPLFQPPFLSYLGNLRFEVDVDAAPEGSVMFACEPLVRVRGPLLQAQLLESVLLNLVNFQTLIATKAARVCQAAGPDPVIEMGLRRAQGVDGALSASRAAHVGGCIATSNVLAGQMFDIPVRGTHAHSWVMSFGDELEAFATYADIFPDDCLLLVDTYDVDQGLTHAIAVGRRLEARGRRLLGIRLDSGDLHALATRARARLDAAGLPDVLIMASNDLDEHLIAKLKQDGAPIAAWGVGTKLVTGAGQAALGGVYKLGALRPGGTGPWLPRIKLSGDGSKTSLPGMLQVRRFRNPLTGRFMGDLLYDEASCLPEELRWLKAHVAPGPLDGEDLLRPLVRGGRPVGPPSSTADARSRARDQMAKLPDSCKRLRDPTPYPVALEPGLARHRDQLNTLALAGAPRLKTAGALPLHDGGSA